MPTSLSPSSRYLRPPFYHFFLSCSLQLYFCLREIKSTFFTQNETSPWCTFFLYRSIVSVNPALPFWKMSDFMFLPAILGTSHCLVCVPLINTVLSKVGIATDYGLKVWGRSSNPGRVKNFLLSTSSIPALGPTQPSIQWEPGALSPGVERPGSEADRSPPTGAEVKKIWIYISIPTYAFMALCLFS
jgi:hypothetical protein